MMNILARKCSER